MLIIGLFIRTPGIKNTKALVSQVKQIVIEEKFDQPKVFTLKKKKSRLYFLFDTLYFISSIGILALVTWGLISLKFSIVSIGLFFFFVSLVSFLAFRVSGISRELEVRKRDDTALTGIYHFVFLPFVSIGKILSEQWSNYNLTLWFWDFIIEAPFKTIMSLFESWLSFVREKREGFE
jgi:ABC-type multidrug transport system fused ATPase/permease subunit